MSDIFAAYNLDIDNLGEFYRQLNEKITFTDGMVTSLGIIYWGRDDHIPALTGVIPQLKAEGIHRFSELRETLRTPGRLKKFAQQTGLSPQLLRILQHDLDLWLPQAVPLADLEPFQQPGYLEKFAALGISTQLNGPNVI